MLASSELQSYLTKQPFKTQKKKWKDSNIMMKMQFLSVFLHLTKIDGFQWKIFDFSGTQGLCHVWEISESGAFCPLLPSVSSPQKDPSWIRLMGSPFTSLKSAKVLAHVSDTYSSRCNGDIQVLLAH